LQTSEVKPTAIANAVMALAMVSPMVSLLSKTEAWRAIVRRKTSLDAPFVGNVARPFIDRSNEMWNFQLDRPLIRCPCPMRKVTQ
jgi:hypothetical protein